MAQGMKRLGMPVAAFFGVAVLGLIATSWFLNRDALQNAVEGQIRAVTGLDLVVNGKIDISVFPASYISFHDVGLKGAAAADPALHVDVLTGNLRLLPLLLRLGPDREAGRRSPSGSGLRPSGRVDLSRRSPTRARRGARRTRTHRAASRAGFSRAQTG